MFSQEWSYHLHVETVSGFGLIGVLVTTSFKKLGSGLSGQSYSSPHHHARGTWDLVGIHGILAEPQRGNNQDPEDETEKTILISSTYENRMWNGGWLGASWIFLRGNLQQSATCRFTVYPYFCWATLATSPGNILCPQGPQPMTTREEGDAKS